MKKLRSQKITIDLPTETAPVWVQAVIQTVYKNENYETTQTVDKTGYVYRTLMDFVTQMETVTDPITGQTITCSGAAAAELIKRFVLSWMAVDYNGTINDKNDLIVEG